MLARTFSAAINGVDAYTVEVEVNATGRVSPMVTGFEGVRLSDCVPAEARGAGPTSAGNSTRRYRPDCGIPAWLSPPCA